MMIIIIFFTSYGGCVLCVTWKEKKEKTLLFLHNVSVKKENWRSSEKK